MNREGFFIEPPARQQEYPTHLQYTGDNQFFSSPECDTLIELAHKAGFTPATIGSPTDQRLDPAWRCVDVAMLPFDPSTAWAYERTSKRVQWANADHWGFDLIGLREAFQVLRYRAPAEEGAPAGHYNWHQDYGAGYMGNRKLSFCGQLSAPEDYDGCALELQTHITEPMPYRQRGDAVLFASWTPHRVTPITRGERFAIVSWVHGPAFR